MSKFSAKEIIKSSSIIAGAQVIQIIFGIIRTKLIALLLGPVGVGQSGLFQTTTQLIGSVFGIGISQTAVKSIAEKNQEGKDLVDLIVSTSLILISIFGIIGTFLTVIFSKELSLLTFKTEEYSKEISFLAVTVFLNLLYACYSSVAQGLRQLKIFAKISVYSSIISLFTTIPLYYFYGIKGIVPALITMSVSNLGISMYFVRPLFIFVKPHFIDFKKESITIIKIGISLSLSGFFIMASSYFIRIFIVEKSGMEGVGLLNAATAITTLYLSLIFTAMGTDFYPKLSGLRKDMDAMNKTVNEQIHIGLIIAGPIIIGFVTFSFLILSILYSSEFISASELMQYQLIGTLFKAFSWPIGFILLTKNLTNIFVFTELFYNLSYYFISILFWHIMGLTAIGVSYLISYSLYSFIIYLIARKFNNFRFEKDSIFTLIVFMLLSFSTFISTKFVDNLVLKWIIILCLNIAGLIYSFSHLKNIYNFREIFQRTLKRLY